MSEVLFQLDRISKSYREGKESLTVLKEVSLSLKAGQVISLLGPSGAGKSTLLHIGGLLERSDSGDVIVNGQKTSQLSDRLRTRLRCQTIGFVYQFHHLLPEFTALENVILPQLIKGDGYAKSQKRAEELLAQVGLAQRLTHLPSELSGGEQQRVAIARALANKPKILLADEPTGNLDTHTSSQVFKLILDQARHENIGALIVTHNPDLASQTDKVFTMLNDALESVDTGAFVSPIGRLS